jgi:hypothetical protein
MAVGRLLTRLDVEAFPPPAPDFRWMAAMPTVGGANVGIVFVEAINWPFLIIDSKPRFGGGTNRHYPEWNNLGAFSITFYETETLDVTNYLNTWTQTIVHTDGSYGLPSVYKLPIELYLYGWEDNVSPVWFDTIADAWPSQQNPFDLNYTNEGRLIVTAQFSCDSKL